MVPTLATSKAGAIEDDLGPIGAVGEVRARECAAEDRRCDDEQPYFRELVGHGYSTVKHTRQTWETIGL